MKRIARQDGNEPRGLVILKLGGSVLTGLNAYRQVAATLGQRLKDNPRESIVAVVSAQSGETDRLAGEARDLHARPPAAALDLLWSTGEIRSVALLTLALEAAGVSAAGLSVHESGLIAVGGKPGGGTGFNPLWIRHHLVTKRVVVVPGFLARGPVDEIVTLGRGGSDLSAVVLAAGLNAERCELIKDVSGYFSKDPNVYTDAEPLSQVDYATALSMARAGCELVQTAALEAAARSGVILVVRSLDDAAPRTIVSGAPAAVLAAG